MAKNTSYDHNRFIIYLMKGNLNYYCSSVSNKEMYMCSLYHNALMAHQVLHQSCFGQKSMISEGFSSFKYIFFSVHEY